MLCIVYIQHVLLYVRVHLVSEQSKDIIRAVFKINVILTQKQFIFTFHPKQKNQ